MIPSARIGRSGMWLLAAIVAAGLVLLLTRIAARERAAALAMSAELLAPLDSSATGWELEREPAAEGRADGALAAAAPVAPRTADSAATLAPDDSTVVADTLPRIPPLDPELYPDWTTFDVAEPLALRAGRPVLLAFTAYGCEQCEELEREVFRDAAAGVTIRSAVVPVEVADPLAGGDERERQVEALQRRFGVIKFPTLVLYFPATGRWRTLAGYPGRDRTIRWVTEGSGAGR